MSTPDLFKVAEVQLTYKNHEDLLKRPQITFTKEVVNLIRQIEEMKINIDYKEVLYAIYVNQAGRILSVSKISEGTTTHCLINIRQIIQGALLQNATGLIVCHNHPSGDVYPSKEDIASMEHIQNAAKIFDIKLLDSFIISSYNYYSFAESGWL
jgi:DNA repair protein RadC